FAFDDWYGESVLRKVAINAKHADGFLPRALLVGMGRVALLPKEFRCAEEQSRSHLPPNHIGPLIDQKGQVAVTLDPSREGVTDDGFGCWSDNERFFEHRVGVGDEL